MSLYLVTGGAGFIGSAIAEYLVQQGENVRILDDFSTGSRENIQSFVDRVELVRGCVCDPELVKEVMKGVDYCLHQAALPSIPRSIAFPLRTSRVNVDGTLQVLKAARDAGVKRFVFASSSSIYGDMTELPKKEDMFPRPKSPYAVGKMAAESYVRIFYEIYGLETVSLRYFNVFGPRQDPDSQYAAVIPLFVLAALDGRRPIVHGNGEQSRDFCYIENIVQANMAAVKAPKEALGKTFNIACNRATTVNEVLRCIEEDLGCRLNPEHIDSRPGDIRHSLASIDAARKYLSYEPAVHTEEGLQRIIAWFKEKTSY